MASHKRKSLPVKLGMLLTAAIVLTVSSSCSDGSATYSVRLDVDDMASEIACVSSREEAKRIARENAVYGYRVYNDKGRLIYCPYSRLQSDILREAKWVTDYVRENGFRYGDAPINPAINCDAGLVSCDRLVDWVLYRVGYTDQVERQGMVVYHATEPARDLPSWCRDHGFRKIESVEMLAPGDIVFVRPCTSSAGVVYPGHTFIFAGFAEDGVNSYRYDCGKNERIQSVQPSCEPLNDFMFAYRPR